MAYTESQKKATKQWREKVGRVQINIEVGLKDRDAWRAYAASKGLTLPGMVRACVDRCMQLDNFAQLAPDAAGTAGTAGTDKAEK